MWGDGCFNVLHVFWARGVTGTEILGIWHIDLCATNWFVFCKNLYMMLELLRLAIWSGGSAVNLLEEGK